MTKSIFAIKFARLSDALGTCSLVTQSLFVLLQGRRDKAKVHVLLIAVFYWTHRVEVEGSLKNNSLRVTSIQQEKLLSVL